MTNEKTKLEWQEHQKKYPFLIKYGLQNNYINYYNENLIEILRNIYYGGIPASILLLSNALSNGRCYERAQLMARAFFDVPGDVKLLYLSIKSLRLNPEYISDNPLYSEHCVVERITEDGNHLIIDTSTGLIYDKNYYWFLEEPLINRIEEKASIENRVNREEGMYPEDVDRDKYSSVFLLPMLEYTFGAKGEMYTQEGMKLLQQEINYYKKTINYDAVAMEINEDMIRMGLIQ